jgi:hypothetical protein
MAFLGWTGTRSTVFPPLQKTEVGRQKWEDRSGLAVLGDGEK